VTSALTPDIFTKRERHIMDVLYRRGHATAREVMSEMGGTQAYSTVRTQLRVLEQRRHVRHEAVGRMNVYTPVVPADTAQRAALQRVIDTFFNGAADAIALLRSSQSLGSPRPQRARRSDGVAR
jgi:BlaI family transcriptional regulator, penicillinase repressor